MKRMMIIAAAFAALVSCSKSETSQNPSTEPGTEDTPAAVEYAFTEGETVTITAGTSLTKVSSSLNDKNGVDFKWETGDKILVSVGDKSSEFTVSKLKDDGANAEFTGTMPASGDEFNVQYPVTDPDLTSQTYTSGEAIPHDKMKFTATGCTVEEPFKLTARYAALRLNLYGTDQTVGKIVVTNTSSTADPKPSYTLNINPAVQIGSTRNDSTSFFIVVEPGSWNFSAEIFDGSSASIYSFETSSEKTFTANQILNMSAKEVKKAVSEPVFSVSATKTVKFTKGNLWYGTKKLDGTAVSEGWHLENSQTAYPTEWSADHVGHFFWTNLTDYKSGTASYMPYASSYSYSAQSTSDKFWCGEDNKLTVDGTEGLYVLTKDEWSYLINSRGSGFYKYRVTVSSGGTNYTNCLIIAPDDFTGTLASNYTLEEVNASGLVCLPAAGYWYGSYLDDGGSKGDYWSATPYGSYKDFAYFLYFSGSSVDPANFDYRHFGHSVRLVCSVSSK